MLETLIRSIKRFVDNIKKWSRPATGVLAVGILSDLKRCRKDLIVENAILRQQLIVLNRQLKRPHH